MSDGQPLSYLAETEVNSYKYKMHDGGMGMWDGVQGFIFWFILIGITTWLVIFSLNPGWAQKSNGQGLDTAKVLLASIIISLIIVAILWLLRASFMSCRRGV
jgi:hypothetical protein